MKVACSHVPDLKVGRQRHEGGTGRSEGDRVSVRIRRVKRSIGGLSSAELDVGDRIQSGRLGRIRGGSRETEKEHGSAREHS